MATCVKTGLLQVPIFGKYFFPPVYFPPQVHQIADVPKSLDCNDLYYRRQVFWWSDYLTEAGLLSCKMSRPKQLLSGAWSQQAEKMAQTALMFSDQLSRTSPDDGIRITSYDAGVSERRLFNIGLFQGTALAIENLLSSSLHLLAFPWTIHSGWINSHKFAVYFGNPGTSERTAYIWGIQFMKEQLKETFVFTLRIGYFKDTAYSHASPEEWIHPNAAPDKTSGLTISVAPTDLDTNGIYWLEEGNKPLAFVASRLLIERQYGPNVINFDFIGTFYDFDHAKSNAKNSKPDDWNDSQINFYLIKGNSYKKADIFNYPS